MAGDTAEAVTGAEGVHGTDAGTLPLENPEACLAFLHVAARQLPAYALCGDWHGKYGIRDEVAQVVLLDAEHSNRRLWHMRKRVDPVGLPPPQHMDAVIAYAAAHAEALAAHNPRLFE